MISTLVSIYFAHHLLRMAEQRGRRMTLDDPRWWWCTALLCAGIVAAVAFVGAMLTNPGCESMQASVHALTQTMVFTLLALPLGAFAWLFGWAKRPKDDALFFLTDAGLCTGPFTLQELKQYGTNGTINSDDLICRKGDKRWVRAASVMDFDERPSVLLRWLERWAGNARDLMQPSSTMNYRIFIPFMLLAFILGALLHAGLADRYLIQAAGGGMMLKTDRWTGKSWCLHTGGDGWYPVNQH